MKQSSVCFSSANSDRLVLQCVVIRAACNIDYVMNVGAAKDFHLPVNESIGMADIVRCCRVCVQKGVARTSLMYPFM